MASSESGFGKVDIWQAPGFKSIQLHRGFKVTQTYPRHWHDEWYFGAILGGQGFLEWSGSSYATPRGSLMAVPPGEIHANYKDGCSFRCLFAEAKALQKIVEDFAEKPASCINFRGVLIQDPETLRKFIELHHLLELNSPNSTLQIDSAVSHFVFSMVTQHTSEGFSLPTRNGEENIAVQKAREFLTDHYADRVTLGELARLTGLSPFHLNRSFCRKIGIPPHAYQIQVRISRAKSLLRLGRGISETAFSTGFVDQSHFSHQFRKFVGVTPGQYAR
jgi:AraC-like DNA-binding protein